MIRIRSFRNTDIRTVCNLWNAHYRDIPTTAEMNDLRLELTCLAKPFFDRQSLLIAEGADGEPVGFLHYSPAVNAQGSDLEPGDSMINALCVEPCSNEGTVAKALLEEYFRLTPEVGRHVFRPALPDCGFYLGLGPADSIASVMVEEIRVCNWLSSAGFQPGNPTSLWEMDLLMFQPPIDRNQIQIRRAFTVEEEEGEADLTWWQACALGHADTAHYALRRKTDRERVASVLFWALTSEVQGQLYSTYWWWPTSRQAETDVDDAHLIFLVAESMRLMRDNGVSTIRSVSSVHQPELSDLFHRLGFAPISSGMELSKAASL